jgi:hypothetical protein
MGIGFMIVVAEEIDRWARAMSLLTFARKVDRSLARSQADGRIRTALLTGRKYHSLGFGSIYPGTGSAHSQLTRSATCRSSPSRTYASRR